MLLFAQKEYDFLSLAVVMHVFATILDNTQLTIHKLYKSATRAGAISALSL